MASREQTRIQYLPKVPTYQAYSAVPGWGDEVRVNVGEEKSSYLIDMTPEAAIDFAARINLAAYLVIEKRGPDA